jgi:hypothetical protein
MEATNLDHPRFTTTWSRKLAVEATNLDHPMCRATWSRKVLP